MEERSLLGCAGGAQGNRIAPPRFRPIAPKPVLNDPLSRSPQPAISSKRSKRKYVRVRKKVSPDDKPRPRREKKGEETRDDDNALEHVATLQLLPEKEAVQETPSVIRECGCHDEKTFADDRTAEIDRTTDRTVVESLVAVECVEAAAACTDGISSSSTISPDRTDEEYWLRRLDADTCPGLISDFGNNVTWVNAAYGRIVGAWPDIAGGCRVRLAVEDSDDRDELKRYGAVTCWVRISWRCTWMKDIRQMMVPCDAWRIDNGGFAWRLDVDAALSLGPCN